MPTRILEVDGVRWRVYPSGFLTPYIHDEYGLIFVRGETGDREVRVTRYSPQGTRAQERSLHELSDADLLRLLDQSQPSSTSPEAGYLP